MAADAATGLASLAASASTSVAGGDRAVSSTATNATATSAPTPFYDQLMSMVQATALDNRCAAQDDAVDAASRVGDRRWSIHPLVPGLAGSAVAATICCVMLVSEASQGQPSTVIAGAEKTSEERSRTVASTTGADEPAERPGPEAGPSGAGSLGVEGLRTTDGGPEPGPAVAADSDERPWATSVAAQRIESLGATLDTGGHDPAVAPPSVPAMPADPIASAGDPTSEQPLPADTPSSLPSALETGSIEGASNPVATRVARVVSDVNMRAGPGNGAAVVATISGGRLVEVIGCRQWCEVIFAGQRGWVYKSFIGASPIPAER